MFVIYQVVRGENWGNSPAHICYNAFINSSVLKVDQLNFAMVIFLILNLKNV